MIPGDCDDMYAYSKLEEVTKYLLWDPHPDRNYTYRYLNSLQSQYKAGTFHDWGVVFRENGRLIGTCGFTSFDLNNGRGEVGYVFNPEYWGRGIAPEALLCVMAFGFRELELNRIEAHYIDGNERSRRVMEKCGMTFEGIHKEYMYIKGKYRDIGFCAETKKEFEKKYAGINLGEERRGLLSRLW